MNIYFDLTAEQSDASAEFRHQRGDGDEDRKEELERRVDESIPPDEEPHHTRTSRPHHRDWHMISSLGDGRG